MLEAKLEVKLKLLVINGPNLNLLGQREPEKYGSTTLKELEENLVREFSSDALAEQQVELGFFQSNHEGAIVDRIQTARDEGFVGIVINPGAYGHTSIAIRDAFLGVSMPFVEIHISNVYQREEFRRHSYLSDIARGVITGLGVSGYSTAVRALRAQLGASGQDG